MRGRGVSDGNFLFPGLSSPPEIAGGKIGKFGAKKKSDRELKNVSENVDCMNDANPALLGRHVVVRVATLSSWRHALSSKEVILSQTDAARADRFRRPGDRERFVLGRILLAQTLGEAVGNIGDTLDLALTKEGRPQLKQHPEIQFSISHSEESVAVALSLKLSVGVDLEFISRQISLKDLAARIFSLPDLDRFCALPSELQPSAFFRAWTAKEAFLKAQGIGLTAGLQEVQVPFREEWSQIPQIFLPKGEEKPWMLAPLPLPADYLGCVVWNDPVKSVDFRVVNPATAQHEAQA